MESIFAGGERAKNGGDADEARSAAAAPTADAGAAAVLADRLCLSGMTSLQGQTLNKHAD
jgi:hypothetical protein